MLRNNTRSLSLIPGTQCFWNQPCELGVCQVALVIKNLPANAGDTRDMGSIPESGKSPGDRHSNPFQKWRSTPVFLPGSPMDKRTQWATVHGVAKPLNNTKHTAHTRTHTHTLSVLGVFSVPRRRLGAGGSYIASEWILVTRKIKT